MSQSPEKAAEDLVRRFVYCGIGDKRLLQVHLDEKLVNQFEELAEIIREDVEALLYRFGESLSTRVIGVPTLSEWLSAPESEDARRSATQILQSRGVEAYNAHLEIEYLEKYPVMRRSRKKSLGAGRLPTPTFIMGVIVNELLREQIEKLTRQYNAEERIKARIKPREAA